MNQMILSILSKFVEITLHLQLLETTILPELPILNKVLIRNLASSMPNFSAVFPNFSAVSSVLGYNSENS